MIPTRRGAFLTVAGLVAFMWLGSAIGTALTGVSDLPPPTSVGVAGEAVPVATPEAVRSLPPRATPSPRAARSRTTPKAVAPFRANSLNWTALARCESSNNPRAVSPSGRYRGAFQADATFWARYGGLEFAPRADLASYAEQIVVAQRGYAVQGRGAWPTCGRLL